MSLARHPTGWQELHHRLLKMNLELCAFDDILWDVKLSEFIAGCPRPI